DPESGYYLLPEYAVNNRYHLAGNSFELTYLDGEENPVFVYRTFSDTGRFRLSDATVLDELSKLPETGAQGSPIVYNTYRLGSQPVYIQVAKGQLAGRKYNKKDLSERYDAAEQRRLTLAKRVKLKTPDRYLNTFGGALAVAADGVW